MNRDEALAAVARVRDLWRADRRFDDADFTAAYVAALAPHDADDADHAISLLADQSPDRTPNPAALHAAAARNKRDRADAERAAKAAGYVDQPRVPLLDDYCAKCGQRRVFDVAHRVIRCDTCRVVRVVGRTSTGGPRVTLTDDEVRALFVHDRDTTIEKGATP